MKNNHYNGKKDIFSSSPVVEARLAEELVWLKQRFQASDTDIVLALAAPGTAIPLSIFVPELGVLEALVLFLADHQHLDIDTIATRTKRSYTTIVNTLRAAREKRGTPLPIMGTQYVPLRIFANRDHAPLQALVHHLHVERKMRFSEIARLLGRDPRVIHATYNAIGAEAHR
jgi:hypothetical protein